MGKKIQDIFRCYQIFIPAGWKRAALYWIYPVAVAVVCWLIGQVITMPLTVALVPSIIILWVEGLVDYATFGGYANRQNDRMEYMKSSYRCRAIYRKALWGDALRRIGSVFSVFLLIAVLQWLFHGTPGASLGLYAVSMGVTFLLAVCEVCVMRFMMNIASAILVATIASVLYNYAALIPFGALLFPKIPLTAPIVMAFVTALLLLLAALLVWWDIRFLTKRLEGWYYDA